MLILCLGCKADAIWQQDYDAFLKELVHVASEAEGSNARGYDSQFEGKEVTWVLSFQKIGQDKDGNDFLLFDIAPSFDLGRVALVIRFRPAPGTSESWEATPVGARVKISAVVAIVEFDDLPIGNDPTETIFAVAASIEHIKRVSD